jgi:hypothetical protein
MFRNMQRAVEHALGENGDFLKRFKGYGWYLDDLVLTPVNDLEDRQREKKCREAQDCLAARIAKYRPSAIVTLLLRIKDNVEAAADAAASNVPRYTVPFPGMGHQSRFQAARASCLDFQDCRVRHTVRYTELSPDRAIDRVTQDVDDIPANAPPRAYREIAGETH